MIDARRLRRGLLALAAGRHDARRRPTGGGAGRRRRLRQDLGRPGHRGMWEKVGVADATETQWSPAGVPEADDVVCLPTGDYQVIVYPGDQDAFEIAGLVMAEGAPGAPTTTLDLEADLTVSGLDDPRRVGPGPVVDPAHGGDGHPDQRRRGRAGDPRHRHLHPRIGSAPRRRLWARVGGADHRRRRQHRVGGRRPRPRRAGSA